MAKDRVSLMTAREAAKYLRVSMFTLSKMGSNGGLVRALPHSWGASQVQSQDVEPIPQQ